MGGFQVDGLSALSASFDKLAAMPDDVVGAMLREGADVLAKAQQDGGDISLTPEGSRRRGNTTTRNAEIAYVNEYGKEGQPGTGFISKANFEKEDEAIGASAKVYHDWLDRIGL